MPTFYIKTEVLYEVWNITVGHRPKSVQSMATPIYCYKHTIWPVTFPAFTIMIMKLLNTRACRPKPHPHCFLHMQCNRQKVRADVTKATKENQLLTSYFPIAHSLIAKESLSTAGQYTYTQAVGYRSKVTSKPECTGDL